MNLLGPLELEQASTENLMLVPTKKFFKPVLVITVPLDREASVKIGLAYLFDEHGNPHSFEGSHKIPLELSGADVSFVGKTTTPVTLRSEKVAHFSCFLLEKEMQLRVRIHFPEGKEDKQVDDLFELLNFLRALNKEAFTLTISPQQGGLGFGSGSADDGKFPVADDDGNYSENRAIVKPFSYKLGRSKGIKGAVMLLEVEAGFIGGWNCDASGLSPDSKAANIAGKALTTDLTVFDSESEALESAVRELYQFATQILAKAASSQKEHDVLGLLLDWCAATCPAVVQPAN